MLALQVKHLVVDQEEEEENMENPRQPDHGDGDPHAYGDDAHPFYGCDLDVVVTHMATLDLLPASLVSRAWRAAVLFAHRRSPRPTAWLFLHVVPRSAVAVAASTLSFDPLCRAWHSSTLQLSAFSGSCGFYSHVGGAGLCAVSGARLALAADASCSVWRELEAAPRRLQQDAIVAVVGGRVVVARGGACQFFEDEEPSIEVYHADGPAAGTWESCEPTADAAAITRWRWSASTTSVTVQGRRMYVLEKQTPGWISWFEPEDGMWGPTVRVRLPGVFLSAIGFAGGRLILAGAVGAAGLGSSPQGVRLWAVNEQTLEVDAEEEIGKMPKEMVDELVGGGGLWSIGFACAAGFGYIYNPSNPKAIVLCEFGGGGGVRRWEVMQAPAAAVDELGAHKVVYGCSAATTTCSLI